MSKTTKNTVKKDTENTRPSYVVGLEFLLEFQVSKHLNSIGNKKNIGQKIYTEFDCVKGEYSKVLNCKESTVQIHKKGKTETASSWSLTSVPNEDIGLSPIGFYAVYDLETGTQVWAYRVGTLPRGLALSDDDVESKYNTWYESTKAAVEAEGGTMRPLTEFGKYVFLNNGKDVFSSSQMASLGSLKVTKFEATQKPGVIASLKADKEALIVERARKEAISEEIARLTAIMTAAFIGGDTSKGAEIAAQVSALEVKRSTVAA